MTDIWSRAKRSEVMARIRGRDTRPERVLRAALRHGRIAYRSRTVLPGRPDIVLKGVRVAIFVHGDFWHGCPEHYREPSTRRTFWAEKLTRNAVRHLVAVELLQAKGWRTLVIWECEIEQDIDRVLRRVRRSAAITPRTRGLQMLPRSLSRASAGRHSRSAQRKS
ncbi:MAG: very short patch repair endonuclease [Candidatus Lutacidiplasmatales archaeon]